MDFDAYAPIVMAILCGIILISILSKPKPRFPVMPRPFAVFDEHGILWNRDAVGKPQTRTLRYPNASTSYELMQAACKAGGSELTAGKRRLKKRHWVEHQGRQVEKLEFEDHYDFWTFTELAELMGAVGSGLASVTKFKNNDSIIIYAETAREWFLAAQGAFTQGLTVVTVYATLGEEGFLHGALQTKAKLVVADAKLLKVLGNVYKSSAKQLKHLKTVVYIPDEPTEADPVMEKAVADALSVIKSAGVAVYTLDEIIDKGKAKPMPASPPKPEDLAIIMYTSGTTGLPKGVTISHANVIACVAGIEHRMPSVNIDGPGDVYLAYMPLAHIMELAGEMNAYAIRMQVGYGSPHTLTPTGVKLMTGTCLGDAQVCKPTLVVMAPAILDKVFVGLQAKMKGASPLVQKLFAKGIEAGAANFDKDIIGAPFLYNAIVFKKVQAVLGGKVKGIITGSAPLAPGIQKFAQTAFNCPVRQGYGLTETCASSCISYASDNTTSVVGPPTTPTCIKLRDWPEGGYKLADKNDPEIGMPRGEVLIGGAMVCQGYLIDPENPDQDVVAKNKTEFEVDAATGIRFFCSGDIGQITPDGNLQIIDRKKDLVKLQQGEYVALSKVESALKMCSLVEFPMVYAESTRDFCIALICPAHAGLKALAKEKGIDEEDVVKLCKNQTLIDEISKQCTAMCKKAKLVGFETPRRYALVADTFSPENDILTAAMKLKRPVAAKVHKDLIAATYK